MFRHNYSPGFRYATSGLRAAGAFESVGNFSVACAVRTFLGRVVVRTAHATLSPDSVSV